MGYLHIITNTVLQSRFSHFELARMAFAGGADVVQYRNKNYQVDRDLAELLAIAALPRAPHQQLIINDDPALAAQVDAQGVHVGLDDPEVDLARALLPPQAVVGATVHFPHEWEAVRGKKIDYIGVGPVYGTQSKDVGLPPLGLKGLAEICKMATVPVIGIGSIRRANTLEVLQAGAAGVAVLSEFCLAEDPEQTARDFRKILDQFNPA